MLPRMVWGLILTLFSFSAFSFALSAADIINQTAVGPLLKNKPKHIYTPAIGVGSRMNGLSFDSTEELTTTNRNAYIIGLDVDGSNSVISLPFKDPSESRNGRVDSNLIYTNVSLNLTPHIKTDFSYDFVKGYLVEEDTTRGFKQVLFPNLSFETIDFSMNYMFNDKHTSFLFSPIVFRRSQSSSSWLVGGSARRHVLGALGTTQSYAPFRKNPNINDATIYSLSIGGGYSISKFYQNWFWGGAISAYYDFNSVQKNYLNSPKVEKGDMTASSLINFTAGYSWTSLTTGFYTTVRTWSIYLDQMPVRNNQGKTGWYFSYVF